MRIFTSRYQNAQLATTATTAVRISRGAPRWKLKYKIAAAIPELMPTKDMLGTTESVFKPLYFAQLRALGPKRVKQLIRDAAAKGDPDNNGVALLCFCDLDAVNFCHREFLAQYLIEECGVKVMELL